MIAFETAVFNVQIPLNFSLEGMGLRLIIQGEPFDVPSAMNCMQKT